MCARWSPRTRAALLAGLFAASTGATANAPAFVAFFELRAALERRWPDNRTITIVCHGHSVPAGYARTPVVRPLDAYPHLLRAGLAERFPHAVVNVIVTAIGGEDSEQGAARFARDVLALRPDLVTIDYALNDQRIGLERAERAWRAMIEATLAQGGALLLFTPTPDSRAKLHDPEDPLRRHASRVRALSEEYRVGLVDSLAAFQRHVDAGRRLDDLLAQPNHPNAAGHALVAAELLRWFPVAPRSP